MSKKVFLLSALAASLVLTACHDPKEANKENFGKAIQEYLDTQYAVCIGYPRTFLSFPENSPFKNSDKVVFDTKDLTKSFNQDIAHQLRYLVEKGLFTETTEQVEVLAMLGKNFNIEAKVYSPTEKAKSYLTTSSSGFGNRKAFCAGKVELVEVGTFTEPADAFGMKVSQVNYTVKTKDLADWATDPKFEAVFKHNKNVAKPDQRMALILTNEGWKSERLMKQK